MKKSLKKLETSLLPSQSLGSSRRKFLKTGGLVVAGSGLLLYSCNDDDDNNNPDPDEVFDLGGGDLGILNYAYALEQLEAAFYRNVLDGAYFAGAAAEEKQILEDLYNHEVIHREFFKVAITAAAPSANQVLPTLEFNFSAVNFGNRDAVLATAKVLEDTGVAAYNGAGKLLQNTGYLLLAGKIVSVEARHASAIRDLINPGTAAFAGDDILVDLGGSGIAYDRATPPATILAAVGATGFVTTEFTANNLPTS